MLTSEQKQIVREAYAAIWNNDERMTNFCTNKVTALAMLANGAFIPVDKQSINKDFCFGESGYDYEDAAKAAAYARTSEGHFIRENMKEFADWLKTIREQYQLFREPCMMPDVALLIVEHPYIGQPETSPLKSLECMRWHDVIDAFGGSCRLSDLPGTRFERYNRALRFPTREELEAIEAAYKEAADEHEKKIKRYLKRYGLSKVHAWTYWRDA